MTVDQDQGLRRSQASQVDRAGGPDDARARTLGLRLRNGIHREALLEKLLGVHGAGAGDGFTIEGHIGLDIIAAASQVHVEELRAGHENFGHSSLRGSHGI